MPVVEVNAASRLPASDQLRSIGAAVEDVFGWRCWILWRKVEASDDPDRGPVVLITCKDTHAHSDVRRMAEIVRDAVASIAGRKQQEVFVSVRRVREDEVLESRDDDA